MGVRGPAARNPRPRSTTSRNCIEDVAARQLAADRLGGKPAHQMDLVAVLERRGAPVGLAAEPATAASPGITYAGTVAASGPESVPPASRQRQPRGALWGRQPRRAGCGRRWR